MRFNALDNRSIHDLIFEEFDVDLPIASGTGTSVNDPIVMSVDENYVHHEYLVLEFLGYYRFTEWQFKGQSLLCCGDKRFDCITISVCDLICTDSVWTEEYFFDITDCMGINADRMVEMK